MNFKHTCLLTGLLLTLHSPASGAPVGDDFCITPLKNGHPVLEVEKEQPYRIASNPVAVGGQVGLLVQAVNRHEVYQVDNDTFRRVEAEFPHVWGFGYPGDTYPLPSGEAVGIGHEPRKIYYLAVSGNQFNPVLGTEDYQFAIFDTGSQSLFFVKKGEDTVHTVDKGASGESTLPPLPGKKLTDSILFIPELDGFLFNSGEEFWFHQNGKSAWMRIRPSTQIAQGGSFRADLEGTEAYVDAKNGLLKLRTRQDGVFVFRVVDGVPNTFERHFHHIWYFHTASGTALAWEGAPSQKLEKPLFGQAKQPRQPHLLILENGQIDPRTQEDIFPNSRPGANDWIHFDLFVGDFDKRGYLLLRTSDGRLVFDGSEFQRIAALDYDRIGIHDTIYSVGGFDILLSERSAFKLNPDLTVEEIEDFPIQEPWSYPVSIEVLEDAGTYFVLDKKTEKLFSTTDFESFREIEADVGVKEIVARIPGRSAFLVVTEQGAAVLENACQ